MRQTIDAIRNAIEKEYWLPALALALTIPDVMCLYGFVNPPSRSIGPC